MSSSWAATSLQSAYIFFRKQEYYKSAIPSTQNVMPIRTVLDDPLGIIMQIVTNSLVTEEVVQAQKDLYLSAGHDPNTAVLWDLRKGNPSGTNHSEIEKMVHQSSGFWNKMSGGRTAILADSVDGIAVGRMYKSLAAAMPRWIRVFHSYDDAMAWLQEAPPPGDGWRLGDNPDSRINKI